MRLRGRLVVAPSIRYLDVAHDAAKYGRISDEPWLEATIPSLADPLLVDGAAASGVRHVMSVLVQSAPAAAARRLTGRSAARPWSIGRWRCWSRWHRASVGWWSRGSCTRRRTWSGTSGSRGGHPLHGEPSLDQWFAWRPMLGYARYRMPLDGLYLCGSGAHPGGGVTGVPGRNAAREVIADRKRSSG